MCHSVSLYTLRMAFSFFWDSDTQDFSVCLHFSLYGLFLLLDPHRTSVRTPISFRMAFFFGLDTQDFIVLFSCNVDTDFFTGYATIKLLSVFVSVLRRCPLPA